MKKTAAAVLASMAAATGATFFASCPSSEQWKEFPQALNLRQEERSVGEGDGGDGQSSMASAAERFAPRFDGLRFIETLVTAHR